MKNHILNNDFDRRIFIVSNGYTVGPTVQYP